MLNVFKNSLSNRSNRSLAKKKIVKHCIIVKNVKFDVFVNSQDEVYMYHKNYYFFKFVQYYNCTLWTEWMSLGQILVSSRKAKLTRDSNAENVSCLISGLITLNNLLKIKSLESASDRTIFINADPSWLISKFLFMIRWKGNVSQKVSKPIRRSSGSLEYDEWWEHILQHVHFLAHVLVEVSTFMIWWREVLVSFGWTVTLTFRLNIELDT